MRIGPFSFDQQYELVAVYYIIVASCSGLHILALPPFHFAVSNSALTIDNVCIECWARQFLQSQATVLSKILI